MTNCKKQAFFFIFNLIGCSSITYTSTDITTGIDPKIGRILITQKKTGAAYAAPVSSTNQLKKSIMKTLYLPVLGKMDQHSC